MAGRNTYRKMPQDWRVWETGQWRKAPYVWWYHCAYSNCIQKEPRGKSTFSQAKRWIMKKMHAVGKIPVVSIREGKAKRARDPYLPCWWTQPCVPLSWRTTEMMYMPGDMVMSRSECNLEIQGAWFFLTVFPLIFLHLMVHVQHRLSDLWSMCCEPTVCSRDIWLSVAYVCGFHKEIRLFEIIWVATRFWRVSVWSRLFIKPHW